MGNVKLPIDVVPGSSPPRFRWRSTVGTPAGVVTVNNEATLPPSVENAVLELVVLARKLQAFKNRVHEYLDIQGVPEEFTDGKHSKEGCRIGDRLDWLVAELTKSRAMNEELAARVAGQSELLSKRAELPAQTSSSKGGRGAR